MAQFEKRANGIFLPGQENFEGFKLVDQDAHYSTYQDADGGIVRRIRQAAEQARFLVDRAHQNYPYAEGMRADIASANVVQIFAVADGATYTNSTTETSLLPAPAVFSSPAPNWWYVGKTLRLIARGEIATGAAPGNLNFRVRYGSATAGIVIADTGAIAMTASIATKFMWKIEVELTCRAVGSGTSGSLFGQGDAFGMTSLAVPVLSPMGSAGNATPAAAGVDTTTATTIQLTALTSAAVAATQIILHYFTLEALN